MQRIVDLLLWQNDEPRPLSRLYPWLDQRFEPIWSVLAELESQQRRRALKTHLPFDGLPIFDEVFYIHVGRDGRDASLSFHHHLTGFTEEALTRLDREGAADPLIADFYPRPPPDPADFFHVWLTRSCFEGHEDGCPTTSFFKVEQGYWNERWRSNLLLVHYNDLIADLAGEMRRIASFLKIRVNEDRLPELVGAARLDAMRKAGDELMPTVTRLFTDRASRFFNRGTNRRWDGAYREEDLRLYQSKIEALSPECATWIEFGRNAHKIE